MVPLSPLYGVKAKRLNEQVKRNRKRFPEDFMFQLSKEEKDQLVENCDRLDCPEFSVKYTEYVFSLHSTFWQTQRNSFA
ncbi:MAG TPA: hypothetical protein DET40_23445 [Lentisphaeria bacterium]|nr:hypothetical protein [Lentisphaeria bacterium]